MQIHTILEIDILRMKTNNKTIKYLILGGKSDISEPVIRGGSFNNAGTDNPVCNRNGNNTSETNYNINIGFRVVL